MREDIQIVILKEKQPFGRILTVILIRGAGDIASGIALRLYRAGLIPVMTDLQAPTSIRRGVCFSEALRLGETRVEEISAQRCGNQEQALNCLHTGSIPVLADDAGLVLEQIHPRAVVDARLAKVNLGTRRSDAFIVVGIGPGFTAGEDCHAVVETKRGHRLGRVLYAGSAQPNTGIPGNIGGYTSERLLRAPAAGIFTPVKNIGDIVTAGETVAFVEGMPMRTQIAGVLRGILPEGTVVFAGMKSGDVDPRGEYDSCFTVSDKALAVGGGVLEALLHLGLLQRGILVP